MGYEHARNLYASANTIRNDFYKIFPEVMKLNLSYAEGIYYPNIMPVVYKKGDKKIKNC